MRLLSDGKRVWRWIAMLALGVSVIAFMLPAVVRSVNESAGHVASVRVAWLLAALLLAIVVRPLTAVAWKFVLMTFGYRISFWPASRIWLTSESCRWLPGGFWHFGSRAVQTSAYGVPLPVAVASMGLEMLLTIVACLGFAVVGVMVYGRHAIGAADLLSLESLSAAAIGGVLLAAVAAASCGPLRRLCPRKYAAIRERLTSLRQVHPRALPTAACLVIYGLLVGLNGLAFYATAESVVSNAALPCFAAVASNSLAWVVGLVAVVSLAPAGLGIREGALVLQLSVWLQVTDAVLVAILWRMLLVIVELLWVAVAAALPIVGRACLVASTERAQQPEDVL